MAWRLSFFLRDGGSGTPISPWHDVPLMNKSGVHAGTFNMVVEIPKWTRQKFEVDTTETFNPIRQDLTKEGHLRAYDYGDMLFNYGMLPQTWENPHVPCEHSGLKGDDDREFCAPRYTSPRILRTRPLTPPCPRQNPKRNSA